MDEFAVIRRFFSALGAPREDVRLGVGDDAAVLAPPRDRELLLTVDVLVAGRHFPADGFPPEAIGHRALAANLSDIAAMGGEPAWALIALTLPAADEAWLAHFAGGFGDLAARTGVAVVGGNIAAGPLTVAVTLAGHVACGRALARAGAHSGDALFVTGALGGGAAGLRAWCAGHRLDDPSVVAFACPEPRLRAGHALAHHANAGIDISDGLVGDLAKLLAASGNLGADLESSALPLAPGAGPDDALGPSDDYELLFSIPGAAAEAVGALDADRLGCALHRIGAVTSAPGIRVDGAPSGDPAARGYRHFE